jgi:hypothetical protein
VFKKNAYCFAENWAKIAENRRSMILLFIFYFCRWSKSYPQKTVFKPQRQPIKSTIEYQHEKLYLHRLKIQDQAVNFDPQPYFKNYPQTNAATMAFSSWLSALPTR